jgi:hypothetical protein
MLLPDNVHPEHTIYYNGAIVYQAIVEHRAFDLMELYMQTQKHREMSMPVFVLCLDWLFLLEVVTLNEQGRIELCS